MGHTLTVHQPPPPARAAPVSLYRCVRVGARAASERVTDGVRAAGTAGPYQADPGGRGFGRRGSPKRGSAGLRKLAS